MWSAFAWLLNTAPVLDCTRVCTGACIDVRLEGRCGHRMQLVASRTTFFFPLLTGLGLGRDNGSGRGGSGSGSSGSGSGGSGGSDEYFHMWKHAIVLHN